MGMTEEEMQAFDELPFKVQEILRRADELWSARNMRDLWKLNEAKGVSLDRFVAGLERVIKVTEQRVGP
jgi:hypothetical protein